MVFIGDGKTHRSRSFTIIKKGYPHDRLTSYRKYIDLGPENMDGRRLVIAYHNGR